MDVTPLVRKGTKIVQSYSGGGFRISGENFTGPVIIFPDSVQPWSGAADFDALSAGDFTVLAARAANLDVVLLGCGPAMKFLPPALKAELRAQGLSIDTMDTGAACRTYNLLVAEGRRIAAGIFPS